MHVAAGLDMHVAAGLDAVAWHFLCSSSAMVQYRFVYRCLSNQLLAVCSSERVQWVRESNHTELEPRWVH